MKSLKQFLYITLITGILTGLSFQPASAATPQPALIDGTWYVATTGNDANDCATPSTPCATINGAIGKAAAGNTILIATGTYTSSGIEVVLINKNIALSGGWHATFSSQIGYATIDGQNTHRGVTVNSGVSASLDHFIVRNGYSDVGGGVHSAGNMTITNSSIQNNYTAGNGIGGGIYTHNGNLTLNTSSVSNNSADYAGGGIYNQNGNLTLNTSSISNNFSNWGGGGIYHYNLSLILNNTTISNNSAAYYGGGIYEDYGSSLALNNTTITNNSSSGRGGGIYQAYGSLTLNNTTVSNNSASYGGGIHARTGSLSNSILGGNTALITGPDCYPGLSSTSITSGGNNIISSTADCFIPAASGDLFGVDPKLGTFLAELGYQPLRPGSPAIDAGNPATCLPTDQRGVARVGTCDIGAYEYTGPSPATSLAVISGNDQHIPPSWTFSRPLQVVALDSQGIPVSNINVMFAAPTSGASGTFAASGTNTTSVLTDVDGVATASTFTANAEFGAYQVSASASGLASTNFDLQNGAWYVSPTGSDANSCALPTTPCRTINGAIDKAVSGDVIFVATGTYIGSGNEVVLVNKSLSLSGGWDAAFSSQNVYAAIDGQHIHRGVSVSSGVIASLDRFIIRNGSTEIAGGSNADGGGVYNAGTLTITNSSIQHNSATYFGSGGGIANDYGTLTLNNTTVSNNSAINGLGGGIFNSGNNLVLNNTTISDNSAGWGGGIYSIYSPGIIRNSIIAGNTAFTSGPDCADTFTSSGNNIIGDTSGCTFTAASGDQWNVVPMLGTFLAGPGYHPLRPGSPAINAGNPATCLPADQRGVARVGTCDIGAYEYTVPGPAVRISVMGGSDQHTPPLWAFVKPFQAVALDSQGSPVSNVTVTFTAPASGASGTFAASGTNATSALTDQYGIATTSIFTANATFGIYQVSASASDLASTHFDLQNGAWYVSPTGSDTNSCALLSTPCQTLNGAINKAVSGDTIFIAIGTYTGSGNEEVVLVNKSLILLGGWDATFSSQVGHSTIDGQNTSQGVWVSSVATAILDRFIIRNGRGGVASIGNLTITNSSIHNNFSSEDGGGISQFYGSLTVKDTTISHNSAADSGGGIYSPGNSSLTLNNVTVSDNSASWGGGVAAFPGVISNSIIAGNTASTSGTDCYGTLTSSGNNIIGNTSGCTFTAAGGDQLNVNPILGTFLPEPGYQPLRPGSPAIDAGNPATCLLTDQRGVARVGTCDVGAYEYTVPGSAVRLYIVSGNGQHAQPLQTFAQPLQVVALDNQGSPVSNVTVTFATPASGASGTFVDSGTNTSSVLTDQDGVATTSTFTANTQLGGYQVVASASGLAATNFNLQNTLGMYVSPTGDNGNSCALVAAPCRTINGGIDKAHSGETIFIVAGTYIGTSTDAEVVLVNKNITLSGGWDVTFSSQNGDSILDGQNARAVVSATTVTASLDRFIVTNGSGGGVFNNGGNLTITNSSISNNSSYRGGGIDSIGSLTLKNTTVSHNSALGSGDGGKGGGIYKNGSLILENTTITNNSASQYGGGIYQDSGDLTLNNTTVSYNSASYGGGGIFNDYYCVGGEIPNCYYWPATIGNSILGGNTTSTSGPDCTGGFTSSGNNIISNTSGCTITAAGGDRLNIDPMLGSLAYNGGPTQTMALLPGSPAIDTGNPSICLPTDQRGAARVGICDIGAYEFNGALTAISGNTGVGGVMLNYTDGTPQTVTSDENGNYAINVPYGWSGMVTPSKAGNLFSPVNRTYSNVIVNQLGQNYVATAMYTISGNVGAAGAILNYTGGWTQSQANGSYSITVPNGWSGTVIPSLAGVTFTPANHSYNNVTSNITGENYSASVTLSGNAEVAGATLSYVDGTPKAVISDGSANYTITVPWGWSGTVTPSLAADAFCPSSQAYNNLVASKTQQNYAHALCPNFGSISKWTSSFDLSHGWTVGNFIRTVGDVDGDGDDDLVGFGQDGVYVALSNGTGFDTISKWTSAFDLSHGWTVAGYVRTLGDVSGDGKADLVGFGLDGVYVALSNGTGFDTISKWMSAFDLSHGWTVAGYVRTLGDVNGDGFADLVGFGLDGVYVALSNGSGFDPVSKWTSGFALANGWTVSQYTRTVGDVNGDGNADLVGFGLDGVYVSLSNGSGFDPVSKWTSGFALANGWTVSQYVRTVGDVDGDGKADIVGFGQDGVYVGLSTGSTFSLGSRRTTSFDLLHGWTVAQYVRTVGDINADNKADLVGFGLDGVYIVPAQ